MARKKIVLVIVEGASDETALGVALSHFFDRDTTYIHIMHGDITTQKGVQAQKIIAKLGREITDFAKSRHYRAADFKQIIHIVDTDGTYIPDEKIMEDSDCEEVQYENDGIYTEDVHGIIARNKQKRENLYRLRSCGKVWNIPYRVYYMSCNLDHVLHNKRNSTDMEKENDAHNFAKKYKNDVDGFVKFICASDFSIQGDFKTSWQYIEKGMHSIERHSNFGLCLMEEVKTQAAGNE